MTSRSGNAAVGTATAAALTPRTLTESEGIPEALADQADVKWSERFAQAGLLRCVFANPLRPMPVISSAWLTWNYSLIAHMARLIYDTRRFEDFSILADALEEAGCDNADILNHCRQLGEHVRGCWVVDLLLGKS